MKLTRAQKKNSTKNKLKTYKNILTSENQEFNPFIVIRNNYKFIAFLIGICILIYGNSLNNEFSVIDDLTTIVNNKEIQSFISSLKSLNLQAIIHSGLYKIAGINPIPFNTTSLVMHIIISILAFLTIFYLFGKKVAIISSLLFAIHPVNTEPINWISGTTYIYNAFFGYMSILFFIGYKITNKRKYFIYLFITFLIYTLVNFSPWALVIPLALIVIDQFFYNSKINVKSSLPILLLIIPILLTSTQTLIQGYEIRTIYRGDFGGRSLQNQQSLTPVIESYPFTLYSMTRLYVFPKDLTVYYDGIPVEQLNKGLILLISIGYVGLIYFFLKKNRKIAGILILLPVLIAPTFSPKKITWYIAERYLYLGTAFFTTLVALLFVYLEKKIKYKNLAIYLTIALLITYSVRTVLRNNDWDTPETLAKATIKTSSQSVRPYNDLAGYYVINNRPEDAIDYYKQALIIEPLSTTAINNLGYIYINKGLPKRNMDYNPAYIDGEKFRYSYDIAKEYISEGEDQKALYYLSKAIEEDPGSVGSSYLAGQIFSRAGNTEQARNEFNRVFITNPDHTESLYEMGYVEYQDGNLDKAIENLNKVLEINPTHERALKGLEFIQIESNK